MLSRQNNGMGVLIMGENFQQKYNKLIEETSIDNWDNDGGVAISPHRWQILFRLVFDIKETFKDIPEPHPSASGDGSIYLRWIIKKKNCFNCFDVEISPNDEVYFTSRINGQCFGGQTTLPDLLAGAKAQLDSIIK